MIIEGIVTTENEDRSVNVSPMGPTVEREMTRMTLRPFSTSKTFANLRRSKQGVFHVTDDVDLLVRAATGRIDRPDVFSPPGLPSGLHVLASACRWYAFEVIGHDATQPRVRLACRVTAHGRLRDFAGWNRAQFAVLEAAILATRVHLLDADEIRRELDRLEPLVDKTGSERERRAFDHVRRYVAQWEAAPR